MAICQLGSMQLQKESDISGADPGFFKRGISEEDGGHPPPQLAVPLIHKMCP